MEVHDTVFTRPDSVFTLLKVIIAFLVLDDLVGHDVQNHSNGQEHDTKDAESKHGAHGSGYWSPSWQSLLFELGLLKSFDLLPDLLFVSFRYVHNFQN